MGRQMGATTFQDKIVWHDPEQDLIFVKARGGTVTKVSGNPNNPFGNPVLFRTLADVLKKAEAEHPPGVGITVIPAEPGKPLSKPFPHLA
jgi:hypothetical protein